MHFASEERGELKMLSLSPLRYRLRRRPRERLLPHLRAARPPPPSPPARGKIAERGLGGERPGLHRLPSAALHCPARPCNMPGLAVQRWFLS